MSSRLHIRGDYPADWDAIGDRTREEAGHRCIRCGHPYKVGTHRNGEWSPCDEQCKHGAPLGIIEEQDYMRNEGLLNPKELLADCAGRAVYDYKPLKQIVLARWRILTVHHLDGDKSNCAWWNLLALCQRCHLTIQGAVNPDIPYFLEHSDWFKPYVAAHYARKYLGETLTREEVVGRLEELLKLERLV